MEEVELKSRSEVWEQRLADAVAKEVEAIMEEFDIKNGTDSAASRSLVRAITGFTMRVIESGLEAGLIERN